MMRGRELVDFTVQQFQPLSVILFGGQYLGEEGAPTALRKRFLVVGCVREIVRKVKEPVQNIVQEIQCPFSISEDHS